MKTLDKKTEKLKIEIFNNQLSAFKAISLDYYNKLTSQLFELSCDGINELIFELPEDSPLMKLKIKSTYLLELLINIRVDIEEELMLEINSLLNDVKNELIKN